MRSKPLILIEITWNILLAFSKRGGGRRLRGTTKKGLFLDDNGRKFGVIALLVRKSCYELTTLNALGFVMSVLHLSSAT